MAPKRDTPIFEWCFSPFQGISTSKLPKGTEKCHKNDAPNRPKIAIEMADFGLQKVRDFELQKVRDFELPNLTHRCFLDTEIRLTAPDFRGLFSPMKVQGS